MKEIVVDKLMEENGTRLKLLKVDKDDASKNLEGAEFKIWQTDASKTAFEKVYITDASGWLDAKLLPHGTFNAQEVKAPEGYYLPENPKITEFVVTDNGYIGYNEEEAESTKSDTLSLIEENKKLVADFSKKDAATNKELPGAKLRIVDASGNEVET